MSERSRAAGREGTHDDAAHGAASAVLASNDTAAPRLMPPLLAKEPSVLGSLLKTAPTTVGTPVGITVEPTESACPSDMVEVEGNYCPYVEQKCLHWLDPATKLACAEFEKPANPGHCFMKTAHEHFCIDRYEWPNRAGELPATMASWKDAKASCESVGKRLCGDTEWTLACEGPEQQPYPYGDGYERNDADCNVDKPYVWPDAARLYDPETSADELARLDQREPSGSRASCVSPYGVHDMTGNVDEWVRNVSQDGQPYASGLKGGYWGPVRTRCRPMTTGHNVTFHYYQTGFRCCENPEASVPPAAPVAAR